MFVFAPHQTGIKGAKGKQESIKGKVGEQNARTVLPAECFMAAAPKAVVAAKISFSGGQKYTFRFEWLWFILFKNPDCRLYIHVRRL